MPVRDRHAVHIRTTSRRRQAHRSALDASHERGRANVSGSGESAGGGHVRVGGEAADGHLPHGHVRPCGSTASIWTVRDEADQRLPQLVLLRAAGTTRTRTAHELDVRGRHGRRGARLCGATVVITRHFDEGLLRFHRRLEHQRGQGVGRLQHAASRVGPRARHRQGASFLHAASSKAAAGQGLRRGVRPKLRGPGQAAEGGVAARLDAQHASGAPSSARSPPRSLAVARDVGSCPDPRRAARLGRTGQTRVAAVL